MSRTEFRRRLFAAITLAFVCHHVLSQEMIKLTVDDGLSQGFVTSIVQDKAGFIWVGTLNGLNRYDGYDFKVYRNDPGSSISCCPIPSGLFIWMRVGVCG